MKVKSSTQRITAVCSARLELRNRHLSALGRKPAHFFETGSKSVVEQARALRDARNTFEQSARSKIGVVITDVFVGARAPMSRHLDPNFAIHVSTEKRSFDIASLELVSILCSDSQHRAQSHRFCNWSEGVVEVEAFFHKLPANHDTSLELFGKQVLFFDRSSAMFDLEHPSGWDRFGTRTRARPLFAESAVLEVACFSRFMASRH